MIGNDQCRWLQAMDQGICRWQPPIGVRLIPHAVEPDAGDRTVVCEQLRQLAIHEVEVALPAPSVGASSFQSRPAARPVIRMMPVELRVVEEQLQPLTVTLVRELLQWIALER